MIVHSHIDKKAIQPYVKIIYSVFEETFKLDEDIRIDATASLGIAFYPKDGLNRESILKAADTAMYKAKEKGKRRFEIYSQEMYDEVLRRVDMEKRMVQALNQKEFYLVYQPLFYCKNNELYGFEALIRWKTKEQITFFPNDFIPLAEEKGFINDIGEWLVREACKKINEIICFHGREIKISVNISIVQIMKDDFVSKILNIIKEYGIPKDILEIEITESVFINNKDVVIEILNDISKNDIKISLDDFGTGYSSLSYLIDLPINKIKIDKSFIDLIGKDDAKVELIDAVISIADSLGVEVVAEGVETTTQLEYLEKKNCDLIQGYLLSKPLNSEHMEKILYCQSSL